MSVLAIDPGPVESAYSLIGAECAPLEHGKIPNYYLLDALPRLADQADHAAIEMVASYGMSVGADVFETCVWIGRFQETLIVKGHVSPERIKRLAVKLHHCHDSKAKDSNIIQALVDRFAFGEPNRGKGTKKNPGWFFGFAADVWQAYALAVYVADTTTKETL